MTELAVLTCSLHYAFASPFTSCPLKFRATIVILNTLLLSFKMERYRPNSSKRVLKATCNWWGGAVCKGNRKKEEKEKQWRTWNRANLTFKYSRLLKLSYEMELNCSTFSKIDSMSYHMQCWVDWFHFNNVICAFSLPLEALQKGESSVRQEWENIFINEKL